MVRVIILAVTCMLTEGGMECMSPKDWQKLQMWSLANDERPPEQFNPYDPDYCNPTADIAISCDYRLQRDLRTDDENRLPRGDSGPEGGGQ
jgi:hypothetical protein